MPDPIVELTDVTKRYEHGDTDVLRGVNLRVEPGDAIAIVGPSGCGKSTLLNLIGALDTPTQGYVTFDGQPLSTLSEKNLAQLRNRKLGFVFQDHHLLPQCTAMENVLIPTIPLGKSNDATTRAAALLERVGLKDRADYRPGELSGGQRQRVAIVRALINEPKLLLIDEPTGALDEATAAGIVDLLTQLNEQDGVTLLLVTHAPQLARRMKRVMHLSEGQLHEGEG